MTKQGSKAPASHGEEDPRMQPVPQWCMTFETHERIVMLFRMQPIRGLFGTATPPVLVRGRDRTYGIETYNQLTTCPRNQIARSNCLHGPCSIRCSLSLNRDEKLRTTVLIAAQYSHNSRYAKRSYQWTDSRPSIPSPSSSPLRSASPTLHPPIPLPASLQPTVFLLRTQREHCLGRRVTERSLHRK